MVGLRKISAPLATQRQIGWDGERGEEEADRNVRLVVPARRVRDVDGPERPCVMNDRQVQHRIAAERGDELVIVEDRAYVGGIVANPGAVLDENLLRPEGRVERLAPADGIGRLRAAGAGVRLAFVGGEPWGGEQPVAKQPGARAVAG